MVHRVPLVFRRVEGQQRKIENPEEPQVRRVAPEAKVFGDAQANPAQDGAHHVPRIRTEQEEVALFHV